MDTNNNGIEISNGLTIGTALLYLFARMSLAEWATVLAMLAALTTIVYNIIRIMKETKK